GAIGSLDTFPLGVRIGNAVLAYIHYLRVLFWPMDLAVFYPHPGASITPGRVIAGALLLGAITATAVALRKKFPFFFVGWCWFVVTLLPVIGLVQVGKQATADRYTYIPYVGLFVGLAWGGASVGARWSWGRTAVRGVAVGAALALTIAAAVQARYWKDSETLLLHAIRVTKDNSLAQNNLGNYYNVNARPADALPHLQEALRMRPEDPAVIVNIGHSLFLLNRFDEAAANFSRALQLQPSNDVALHNLARVRYLQGDVGQAIRLYRAAVAVQPDWIDARKKLALALLVDGENAAALRELERVVSRFPEDEQARSFRDEVREFIRDPQDPASDRFRRVLAAEHRNLGIALMERKHSLEAAQQLERAFTLFPEDFSTRLNRGVLFTEAARLDEAATEFGEAVRLNPSSALAHTDLGYVLFLQGRRQDAIDQHQEALRLQPDLSLARHNLELAEQDGTQLRGVGGQTRPTNRDGPLHR
ncbi:MAG TPA: tetratricopeptide repeat protein, partial [Thermoanaerobaculia bacterium]|nr:tetratricopeptide repeat protein [Thermoanaerobaculia bacterium]